MRHYLAVAENRRAGAGAERQDHFYSATLDCAKALHVGIVEHAHGLPPMLGSADCRSNPANTSLPDWGQSARSRESRPTLVQNRRDVGKGLVDGNPLDEGREIVDYLDDGGAKPLVVLEMAADKSELRTELARLPSRHAAVHPEGLGFIRSGKHNPTPDGDGLAAQRRVEQLLDRGTEGIQVCVEDGGCRFHPNRSPVTVSRRFWPKQNENVCWRLSS